MKNKDKIKQILQEFINPVMQIIPDSESGVKNMHRFMGTYLEGKLEEDARHDLFSVIIPNYESEEYYIPFNEEYTGIHKAKYKGKDCLLFLWGSNEKQRNWRGLAVYPDDIENYQYVLKLYNNKTSLF
jgi:hypothetical protein